MSQIVRRVQEPLAHQNDFQTPIERKGEKLTIRTQKCLGVQPHLLIEWEVPYHHWSEGFKLLGFRSNSGFASDTKPKDLSAHGQLILEETANGSRQECLPEGTYYYTFLLRKKCMFHSDFTIPVRFSETIPSAKTAIGRIEDQMRLTALQEELELRPMTSEVVRNEAEIKLLRSREALAKIKAPIVHDDSLETSVRRDVGQRVNKALRKAHTILEMRLQEVELLKQLKKDLRWRNLSRQQQDQILKDIAEALDSDEANFPV
jgi:hypothetical protein